MPKQPNKLTLQKKSREKMKGGCRTHNSGVGVKGLILKDVKEMIGHNDLAMTDRYSHLTNRHKQIRQDELARYYWNGMCYNEVGYK